jgi:hypothetical protein
VKKLYTICFLLLISAYLNAQSPNWLWAKSAGGNAWDKAYSIASDNAGNLYVTGYSSSPTITFGSVTLINNGKNMFLVKYDASGNVIWAQRPTNNDENVGYSIATDNAGYVYVAGYFSSFSGTDSITFGTITLTHPGMFLVKYDSSGNVTWAKDIVKGGNTATAVTADNLGNIFVGGTTGGDTLVFGQDTLYPSSFYDRFVAKYDTAGNALWVRGLSTGGYTIDVEAPFIAADKYGNVYVTGGFHNPSCVIVTTVLVNQGDDNIYLAKFNGLGNLLWAKRYGLSGHDDASTVATDTSGNIYIAGSFTSNNITFDGITLPSGGGYTGFVVKLDNGGTSIWAKKIDKLLSLANLKIKATLNEDVYVTGYFLSSALIFTPSDSLINKGLFLAKYDSSGNFKWARDAIGGNLSRATGVTVNAVGNPYIIGYFGSDSIIFDSTVLLNDTNYLTDIYLSVVNVFTSVEEYYAQNLNGLLVFPNPSQGKFYIKTSGNETAMVNIYDIMGKEIDYKIIRPGGEEFDLSSQPKGIYFVTIGTNSNRCSKKIIIQ